MHAGFLRSWMKESINDRVVSEVQRIVCAMEAEGRRVKVLLTGATTLMVPHGKVAPGYIAAALSQGPLAGSGVVTAVPPRLSDAAEGWQLQTIKRSAGHFAGSTYLLRHGFAQAIPWEAPWQRSPRSVYGERAGRTWLM